MSLHCKHYLVLTFLCKVFILCFQKNQLVLHFPVKKYTRNSELSLLP